MNTVHETTLVLQQLRQGNRDAAGRLLPLVYDELRALAGAYFRGQPSNQTLQPTALVHEAYLKLIDQSAAAWRDRAHFLGVAARAMRQILIDHARGRGTNKRGGEWHQVTLAHAGIEEPLGRLDLLALDEALDQLAEVDERQARVVEMRFFAGLTVDATAEVLGVSPRTVELDWKMAKAWLSRTLTDEST